MQARYCAGRMRKLHLVFSMLAIALFFVSCSRDNNRDIRVEEAPDFTLRDISGNKVRLSGLRGKVVLVEFWAVWCPPCIESVPLLKTVYEKYKDKGFVLLGISVDRGADRQSKAAEFIKEKAATYPVLFDDGRVSAAYGVSSIPMSFMINRRGDIVKKRIGFAPGMIEDISREIEALL